MFGMELWIKNGPDLTKKKPTAIPMPLYNIDLAVLCFQSARIMPPHASKNGSRKIFSAMKLFNGEQSLPPNPQSKNRSRAGIKAIHHKTMATKN